MHFKHSGLFNLLFGCREGTLNEPVIVKLHELLLEFSNIKAGIEALNKKLADPVRSDRASGMDFLL